MTAREISAFDEMFDMIFDAVAEKKIPSNTEAMGDSNIGIGRGGISDLFGKLRRHSKKLKWTTESDELLDRQKEAMDMCETDQQLLEWALRHVFEESERYESAARQAIFEAAKSEGPQELPMLQPSTYPHLVALLMRAFRDKYHDPHLALAIFDHARHLSIASYVFGCSTHAYNELIETRWKCFHDLKGVHDALEEMMVNGVDFDSRTRKLIEIVRRENGQRNLWAEESELGSGEVWNMLARIDELLAKPASSKKANYLQKPIRWDEWKALPLADKPDDTWGFNQWEKPRQRKVEGGTSELRVKGDTKPAI
jgi:Mtf2 family